MLFGACKIENKDILDAVIAAGAEVSWRNPDNYKFTPLHAAAAFDNVEAVAALISHGADLNAKIDNGVTPLMRASRWGHVKVVEALLDAGADKALKDKKGSNALDWATFFKKDEVVALLKKRR